MYDRKHILLTWGGTLPGDEEWSCGIRLAGRLADDDLGGIPFSISDERIGELMESYSPAVKTYHQDARTGINSLCKLTFIKAAAIGLNGRYLPDQEAMVEEVVTGVGGGVGNVMHPNQICMVVTTNTVANRGLAKRGRYYLPLPGFQLAADGLISAADAQGVAASSKVFLEAISDVPGIDIISSPGASVMSKVGAGQSRRINSVAVGRALDTQRRRRRSLTEKYVNATVDQGSA